MLARREFFRAELERKLSDVEGVDALSVKALLDEFEQRGWLSDARATQALVNMRQRRFGGLRIRQELQQRGAGDEHIAQAAQALNAGEVERAKAVWRRRFRAPPASREERGKQMRFLAGRGFSSEVIAQVLRGDDA